MKDSGERIPTSWNYSPQMYKYNATCIEAARKTYKEVNAYNHIPWRMSREGMRI